jgi:LmbE family N-acetylglucosaminyl deacetylase
MPLTATLGVITLLAGTAGAAADEVMPPIDAGTSLLVVAPHPDDETLCCAGILQRVVHAGGHAAVVWITSGDAARWDLVLIQKSLRPAAALDLGTRRMAEARAATTRLGVPADAQLFLGYPDGRVQQLLLEPRTVTQASGSTAAAAVPYAQALFPSHPYTGANLARDFAAVLERVRPNLILAPSLEDSHPDHRATGQLVIEAASSVGLLPRVHYWIVHDGEGWPSPRGLLAGVPLAAPAESAALRATVWPLTPAEEDGKQHALEAYATQMRMMAPFLLAFVRTTELFFARPQPTPSAPQSAAR